jgi:acetyltransferase-like isoleucine patch superfamily enzyme
MVSFKSVVLSILRLRSLPKGKVQVGEYSDCQPFILSYHKDDEIKIGKFCIFGSDVMFIVGSAGTGLTNYYLSRLAGNGKLQGAPKRKKSYIIIGNDVWIGARGNNPFKCDRW